MNHESPPTTVLTGPRRPDPSTAAALVDGLPAGWSARPARAEDRDALHAVLVRHEVAAKGSSSTSPAELEVRLASDSHQHVLTMDADGRARGWATAHDRATGRVLVAVTVDPDLDRPTADGLAAALLAWAERSAADLARSRGLSSTQIDTGAFADDTRQQTWLDAAGFTHVRTWLQMTRPVSPEDGAPTAFPAPHPSVSVRRVRRAQDRMPEQDDLVAVHDVLEAAFVDHFNYRQETFEEFLTRLREDPGHRWDHWWLAEVRDDDGTRPAGALIGAVDPVEEAPDGTYVAYLGVPRGARGRGVARSLLHTAIADAARRGRDRVALEVDADSPTGADRLYRATGFRVTYRTQSWHRDISTGTGASGAA